MKTVLIVFLLSAHWELTVAALYRQHLFIDVLKSWSDAQKYCRSNYTDLSTLDFNNNIFDLQEATNVINPGSNSSQNPYYNRRVWVGLNRIGTSAWHWSDGTVVYGNINVHDPDNNDDPCAIATKNDLEDRDCTDQNAFFCYKWEPKLILVKQNKSWEEALQYCRTHHTNLASLPTYYHLIQFSQTTVNSETLRVWTGLRFLSGSWFWVSGEVVGTWFQLPACPDNYMYCGSRNRVTISWENRDCTEKLNFVCY